MVMDVMIKRYSLKKISLTGEKVEVEKSSNPGAKKLENKFGENISKIREAIEDCPDIIMRKVNLKGGKVGYFIYVDNFISSDLIQRDFMKPILDMEYEDLQDIKKLENLPVANLKFLTGLDEILEEILYTNTVFICESLDYAISCNLTNFDKRSIEEPVTEKNIKGPHEGFIETLDINMSILRRKIRNTSLKFRMFNLGTTTKQNVAVAYIDGIANPKLLKMLSEKIRSINYDGLLDVGYIEQFITDHPNSPFPQYRATERPDVVTAALLEGKFVIMLEGTPVVLIVPETFWGFFTAFDDYSTNWMFGTFLVLVRMFAFLIGLFLPGIYIAILSFHYYAVPLTMLVTLAESRAKVPLHPIMEALIMELTLELIRESSVRLPTYVGSAVGIVGGIVIGQAAVQAGLVSNLMVIVVAVTAIASFTTPNYDMGLAIRLLRFIVMICASVFGLIGIVVVGVIIMAHLVSIASLGQPYMQPLVPFKYKGLKDTIVRFPLPMQRKRPEVAQPVDKKRGK